MANLKTWEILEIEAETHMVLFFDLDGTLVETDYANFLAYEKAIKAVTKSSQVLTYNPTRRFSRISLKSYFPTLTKTEFERIILEKEQNYNDFLHAIKLNTDMAGILEQYSRTHQTVLVTNCQRQRAITTLRHFNLSDKFSNIFYGESHGTNEQVNKFQNAISKLGIAPDMIIAFDNEEEEVEKARNAGISVINPRILKI